MEHTDLATRVVHSTDNSIYQVLPGAVASPGSPDEVAELLRRNHRSPTPRAVVARGGGTGTNGQSLTDGLVVDTKRSMQRIVSIDPDARLAVVEPGVVTAALNRRLKEHGLFWAPHTSTMNRATVGGMISTDAAGKGSLVHGRAHRHVAALDLCLPDGTLVHLAPTTITDATEQARRTDSVGRLWRELLALPIDETTTVGPQLARGWSGYGIDRFRSETAIDPVQLVVGAEGTLGVVTRAWLKLTPLPAHTTSVVAVYDTFTDALDESLSLAATQPTAIEAFDEVTLEAARSSSSWPAIGKVVGDRRGAVLVLEYDDHPASTGEPADLDDTLLAPVLGSGRCRAARVVVDPSERSAVWKVRADAVGLLARNASPDTGSDGSPRVPRPTAMIEDCAVPVDSMAGFIAGFRALLDDAGLEYAMFGHADVGCVHVRPALDLTDPAHERLVGQLTERVIDLVDRHGGILWGEHGRGFRGESAERFLDTATLEVMRRVKRAFDPDDRCNPGKLYRPFDSAEPLIGVTEPPLRGQHNRTVPIEVRAAHASAFACNGNGACHDVEAAAPMCPSYQATGDPALSPKGRADLIRAWLAGPDALSLVGEVGDADAEFRAFEDDLATNLHQCLSCAACSGRCPVEVDVPELKSRFLEAYHSDGLRRRRPLADAVMSRFERLAPLAARLPSVAEIALRPAARLLGLVDLPTPARTSTFRPRRFSSTAARAPGSPAIVVVPDVFTSVLETSTLRAAHEALAATGAEVSVADFVPSGKFDHVKGRRTRFAKAVRRQRVLIETLLGAGVILIQIEPAVTLLHGHEYVEMDPTYPADAVMSLAAWLDDHRSTLPRATEPRCVTLLGHCTERARVPDEVERWRRVLTAVGHTVDIVEVGCCGMAGVFGHERPNQEMSRTLWERNWAGAVAEASRSGAVVTATGWSCRSQASRFGHADVQHPVHLL